MKNPIPDTPKNETSILLRLPVKDKEKLDKRARGEHRSTVGHLRYLIERDLEAAA